MPFTKTQCKMPTSATYIHLTPAPCASLALDLPVFTYEVTNVLVCLQDCFLCKAKWEAYKTSFCGRSLTSNRKDSQTGLCKMLIIMA